MSAIAGVTQPPYPLHESVRDLLDPEYVAFYNQHVINNQQVHLQPVAASRTSGVLIPGAGPMLEVGKTHDLTIARRETDGPPVAVRCFTPKGEVPAGGWPVMLYFHGGGWVLGNIDTENVVCSNLCVRGNCVVVTVDYRSSRLLGNPALAGGGGTRRAVNRHVQNRDRRVLGRWKLGCNHDPQGIDPFPPLRFSAQLLSVPVTDNTATVENNESYRRYEHTAALPSQKMIWYRDHYLPNEADCRNPEASPLFYDDDWSQLPPALVMVGELDVLRTEGEQYAEKLQKAGVAVDLQVMKGMPHPFLAMDGVLSEGKRCITLMCDALQKAFWG
ncbi:hypothetical protein N7451_003069 [Penicillium sp. IBT 35674x]|nr:hypothetical protein N7451_003069 [Penicillium sp. IBT 35674x]